jgi:ABC-2 type transport system ATP-binding protein
MLKINNLTKKYGEKIALDSVNMEINKGEIIGLFGKNGAGKTTLLKCILNLVDYKGKITLDNEYITRKNIQKFSFATYEHSFFPLLTPTDHEEFYANHFDTFKKERYEVLMDFFELPSNKPVRLLSAGQQNQFEAILALSQGADYILMDEPFAGNDLFNRIDFYKIIVGMLDSRETLLISTHLIEEAKSFISRAILLDKGKIVGNLSTESMDEKGINLIDEIERVYHYKYDRVRETLTKLDERR